MSDDEQVRAAHDLSTTLRNKGYSVGFDTDDLVEDFDEHTASGQALLDADDLGAFFVIAHRQGQTDYGSSVVLDDSLAYSLIQIEMLGSHFRTVLDTLPLSTTELVDAMVDEALTIDDMEDEENG